MMDATDRILVAAVQDGLPLVPRPYAELAGRCGLTEAQLITRLRALVDDGTIKRFGLVVHHRRLGYRANAMVVWDVADACVEAAGQRLAAMPFVTLCYQRPRRPPRWPYNLFCMIHGRERQAVLAQVEQLAALDELHGVAHEVLFSTRCFKQRGARYLASAPDTARAPRQQARATAP